MALTTKYRSQTLEDMVGQRHIIDILLAQAQQGKFSSAYLLYGPRGTGKTSTARLLAKLVNVGEGADGKPDLVNDPAVEIIDAGKTLDFVEIDAASHTGVDNIREEIIDKALYPPTALKKKVYVIDEVHMLSKGAFNALLKIMEEPKPYLMFVLATTEINKVPDTIISRCQVFNFRHLTVTEIEGRLAYIADQEGFEYEGEALHLIAKLANGAMRDAVKYLEQISILGKITQETVAQFLGVVSTNVLESLMGTIMAKDYTALVKMIDELIAGGTDLYALAKDILLYLDEHFLENPAIYAPMTGMFQEIVAEMKRYPHPGLLWKRKLYAWCNQGSGQTVSSEPSVAKPAPVSLESTPVATESVAPVPTPQPTEKKDSTCDDLLLQVAQQMKNPLLKSALKQQTVIKSHDGGKLHLIVINNQYATMMQKPETLEQLAGAVKATTGEDVSVLVEYMSKEDYMQHSLQS